MSASGTRLEGITKDLREQWLLTRESWNDAKAQEFEARFMQELFASVDKSVGVIEQLDKLISKIRKDCE